MLNLRKLLKFGRKAKSSSNPEILVFGEEHSEYYHGLQQAQAIRYLNPEFLLLEGLDDCTPEEIQPILEPQYSRHLTFGRIIDRISEIEPEADVSAQGLNEVVVTNSAKSAVDIRAQFPGPSYNPESIINPSTYLQENGFELFLDTPRYMLESWFKFYLRSNMLHHHMDHYVEKEGWSVDYLFDRLVGFIPEDTFIGKDDHSPVQFHAAVDVGAKVAGCDVNKKYLTSDLLCEELMEFRNQTMGETILNYAHQRETDNPVIAVVGKDHIKPDSKLCDILLDSEFDVELFPQSSIQSEYNSWQRFLHYLEITEHDKSKLGLSQLL